jgi:hypothetical protein
LHFQRKESKRCHSHGGGNLFAIFTAPFPYSLFDVPYFLFLIQYFLFLILCFLFSWFLWGFRFAVHETPVLFTAFVDAPFRFAYFHPWDKSQGYYLLHFQRKESKRCHSHAGGNLFAILPPQE